MVDQVPVVEARGEAAMIISLLYHDVVPPGQFGVSGFPGDDADIYKLDQPEFESHLEAIERSSSRPGVTALHRADAGLDARALLFTFDDGGASALATATLLETRGWRGHFLVTTDYIGKHGFLTAENILELHQRGHVVGSHSCSHPSRMSHCPRAQLEREWKESVRVLSDIMGEKARVASVPGGYYSRGVAEAAAASGIEVLFNSEPTSRVERVDNCLVVGRYSIVRGDSSATAARLACGDWRPRLRQFLVWNAKKVAKRLGGNYYLAIRKSLLRKAVDPS